jgi:hypothetical protein
MNADADFNSTNLMLRRRLNSSRAAAAEDPHHRCF